MKVKRKYEKHIIKQPLECFVQFRCTRKEFLDLKKKLEGSDTRSMSDMLRRFIFQHLSPVQSGD